MKTINEIQDRIHDLETELAVTKGWAYNALERYHLFVLVVRLKHELTAD